MPFGQPQRFKVKGIIMGIRKISIGLAAAALLGSTSAMAAAPVMPTVAKISLSPTAGSAMIGARLGAPALRNKSSIAAGGALIAVLAAAAVIGGTVAATSGGHGTAVSP